MQLLVGSRARQQIEAIEAWWWAQRGEAGSLFLDELERTFRRLMLAPDSGSDWPFAKRPGVRRLLLQRSQH